MGILSLVLPRRVRVEFIDADTRALIGVSTCRPQQLPQSFKPQTDIEFGGGRWSVVTAEPVERTDFVRQRKLRLHVRRIDLIAPDRVFYSLPTIADALPPERAGSKRKKDDLVLNEDDWRQVEFICRVHDPAMQASFARIREIHERHRLDVGFCRVHVRNELPQPLAGAPLTLRLSDLLKRLGGPKPKGLGYETTSGCVEDGFSVRTPGGLLLYGRARGGDGVLSELCLHAVSPQEALSDEIYVFEDVATKHKLVLVDWCKALMVEPGTQPFTMMLNGG